MSGEKIADERRKHKRYKLKNGAYAIDTSKPGLIDEIGLGGMSLCYIERKQCPEDNCKLDIIYGEDENFRLGRLPYRVVSEHEICAESFSEAKVVKKRRIAFCDLSSEQEVKLKDFIHCTTIRDC